MAEIPIRSFAVSVVLLRKTKAVCEVLLLRRTGTLRGQWCQVAGGIEANETAWQAALRETLEETSLVPDQLYSADICEQFYEADRDAISLLPVFVGFVSLDQNVTINDEHSEFIWVDFKTADKFVPFAGQRRVLEHIEREFVKRAPNSLLLVGHEVE